MDTIYAEATPAGRGGVSIVRLSGPAAREIAEALAGPLPEARRAEFRRIADGELIDRGLVIRFEAGASFTGEEVVEFHLHGAPVIVRRLERALSSRGARLAEAGEFTRRGFLNGVIALSEAEGLADLLAAETEAQRQQAMRIVGGDLVVWADSLRQLLVRAGALVEASLDFADEEVPDEVPQEVGALLVEVRERIATMLAGRPAAERLRAGFTVAIVGPPNTGKSSLMNAIARREVALVSDIPGTTRDIIELHTEIGGLAVTFLDTAGLRDAEDPVERMGVSRARVRAQEADLRIHLVADAAPDKSLVREGDLLRRSKADLRTGDLSAWTGEGIDALLDDVRGVLAGRVAGAGLVARRRQAEALESAAVSLESLPAEPELLAETIRSAIQRLAELVGRVAPDDYLDEIFASFCIGK